MTLVLSARTRGARDAPTAGRSRNAHGVCACSLLAGYDMADYVDRVLMDLRANMK
jgi:hypothetical protein